ncbi:uncharacterized protein [Miscanthus floridulus]|uniref:uncharacterized protein n=1 Tax=Miscanthus floridulus TaxID=154761 RepID=UPI003459A32F
MDPVKRYKRVKKTVVEINVMNSFVPVRDGIVMALMDRDMVVLTSDHDIDINCQGVAVFIPDQGVVKNVTVLASRAGIAILLCSNLTPDQQRELVEVELFEGDLQEFQEVYTYSHQNKYRVLTPGNIMSLDAIGFDHSCSAHSITHYGSPVFNEDAQLVGMCFNFSEYVSSYNIAEIARKIDNNFGREYISVQLSLQNLRQQN